MSNNLKYFFFFYFFWIISQLSENIQIIDIFYRFDFVFSLAAIFFILKEFFQNKNHSIATFHYLLIISLMVIVLINTFRSPPTNIKGLVRFFGERYLFAAWVPIFFVFIGSRLKNWNLIIFYFFKYLKISFFLMLFYLIYFISGNELIGEVGRLTMMTMVYPILLLNRNYFNPKTKRIISVVVFLIFIFSFYVGSRTHTIHVLAFYLLVSVLTIYQETILKTIKQFMFILSISFAIIYVFKSNFENNYFNEFTANNFSNSRTEYVYPDFISDFNSNKRLEFEVNRDWLIGRGLNGSYYSQIFEITVDRDLKDDNSLGRKAGYRTEIESGYLFYVLKIGLIGLILKILIFIIAIYYGFKSRNKFTNTCCFIIIHHLFLMIPGGLPEFSMGNFLVWACVGACLSSETRLEKSSKSFFRETGNLLKTQTSLFNPIKF